MSSTSLCSFILLVINFFLDGPFEERYHFIAKVGVWFIL